MSYIYNMKYKDALPYPAVPTQLLKYFGELIINARKAKHWRQVDLAERISVTRQTMARIEKGDPGVAIGAYVTAAWILDIPLLPGGETVTRATEQFAEQWILQFRKILQEKLPKRIMLKPQKEIDDNF